MPKRKYPTFKRKPRANTIRDRRLAIRTSICRHKSCPSCGESKLEIGGICADGKEVWTFCSSCELNKDGNEKHLCSHLTGWQDVFCTIVDSMPEI